MLSSFLSLFWCCLIQHPYHSSLPLVYCTLEPGSLHIKIIIMFFPGRKPIFHHANIEFFEILTKLSVSSLCLSLVYIYNTALSWFSKFSHSFASESLFSIPFFFFLKAFLKNYFHLLPWPFYYIRSCKVLITHWACVL